MASTLPSRGEAPSPSPAPAPSRRDRALIASCIVLITAVAWAYLVHLNRQMKSPVDADPMMAGMGMVMNQPWGPADLLLTFIMWAVMMVGMMALSALPVLLLFAGMHSRRMDRGVVPAVPLFGLGYLTVWLAFSACATVAQWALHEGALLAPNMATSSTSIGGAILLMAGVYQLTPLKTGCLARCRSPLGFLMSNWRDGPAGAFRMGLRHGVFCMGCCWALMALLFVVGVMNLAWVGVLTLFILAEKLGPTGARVSRAGGAILIALAAAMLILPAPVRAQSSSTPQDTAAFRYLAGDWNVVSHRRGDGAAAPASGETLRFTPAPAGVGLVSYWRMNRGSVTRPQMTDAVYVLGYDRPSARWSFYFVSDRSAQFYDGKYEGGNWYFYREYLTPAGGRMLQRQSWRRVNADEVRRLIEDSPDGGATWSFVYEGILRRAAPG